jgi:hypothetical protein
MVGRHPKRRPKRGPYPDPKCLNSVSHFADYLSLLIAALKLLEEVLKLQKH